MDSVFFKGKWCWVSACGVIYFFDGSQGQWIEANFSADDEIECLCRFDHRNNVAEVMRFTGFDYLTVSQKYYDFLDGIIDFAELMSKAVPSFVELGVAA